MPDGFEDDIQKAVRKVRDKAYKSLYASWNEEDYVAIKWALGEVRSEFRAINRERLKRQQNVAGMGMRTYYHDPARIMVNA